MDTSNNRSRRNGNSPERKSKTPPATVEAQPGANAAAHDEVGEAGNRSDSRIHLDTTAGSAPRDASAAPRGLQDTLLDERNDVLAVITELEDQLDRQQEIRESMERQVGTSAEQLQIANQRVQELEWQVVTLQTRVDALEHLRHDIATLEEELNDANSRAQRAAEQFGAVDKERARLKTELKSVTKQADELWAVRKERDGLRSDYKVASTKVDELERAQREAVEERATLQSQMQELQATIEELTGERNQLTMSLRAAEDRTRELAQVQDALEEKIDALRTEKKALQVQMTHVERENVRLVDQRQFYECELTALRNQNRTAESALANVKKAFTEVRIALTETKSRVRRRTLDSWPRVGSTLRGIEEAEFAESEPPPASIAEDILGPAEALAAGISEPHGLSPTIPQPTPDAAV